MQFSTATVALWTILSSSANQRAPEQIAFARIIAVAEQFAIDILLDAVIEQSRPIAAVDLHGRRAVRGIVAAPDRSRAHPKT